MKSNAGLIEFNGYFVKGLVWSNNGSTPVTYNNEAMASKMAARHGVSYVYSARGNCFYLVKE